MNRLFLILVLVLASTCLFAQNETEESPIQKAYEACIAMRDAVENNDTAMIKQAAERLKNCNTRDFSNLRCKNEQGSLKGHMVFDDEFANMLVSGEDAYSKADTINENISQRGQTADGSIRTKNFLAKAGKSVKCTFTSKNRQDIAVVAEAGGRVTMKIRVTNKKGLNKRYDDTEDVKRGKPNRKTSFRLPNNCMNIVELEVINCSKKDISFVVIKN